MSDEAPTPEAPVEAPVKRKRGWQKGVPRGLKGKAPDVTGQERLGAASKTVVQERIFRRIIIYQEDALHAMHSLAMMPISDNPLQNQVKLRAAHMLVGGLLEKAGGERSPQINTVLQQLDDLYHSTAPRIKAMRERVVYFQNGQDVIEHTDES